ncbi:hypothetical protein Vafri_232, partial [Volvox africanus]
PLLSSISLAGGWKGDRGGGGAGPLMPLTDCSTYRTRPRPSRIRTEMFSQDSTMPPPSSPAPGISQPSTGTGTATTAVPCRIGDGAGAATCWFSHVPKLAPNPPPPPPPPRPASAPVAMELAVRGDSPGGSCDGDGDGGTTAGGIGSSIEPIDSDRVNTDLASSTSRSSLSESCSIASRGSLLYAAPPPPALAVAPITAVLSPALPATADP